MTADALMRRLVGKGVTVSAVHPGFVSFYAMYICGDMYCLSLSLCVCACVCVRCVCVHA